MLIKKNGNDFGDEIKECSFVIFASYFTGGINRGGARIDNTLTNITKKRKTYFKKRGRRNTKLFLDEKQSL